MINLSFEFPIKRNGVSGNTIREWSLAQDVIIIASVMQEDGYIIVVPDDKLLDLSQNQTLDIRLQNSFENFVDAQKVQQAFQ